MCQSPGKPKKIRVLIADDRLHSRAGLRALVATWDKVEVIAEASNGQEAVQLTETCGPHVVLMDIRMPMMDGLTATRIIKDRWPQVKVVILTMYAIYRNEALSKGADAFLLKGCSTKELFAAICDPVETACHETK